MAPRASFSTVGQCFDIEVSRDASGWAIRVPEIEAVTYARRRAEVSAAARECIAAHTGIPIGYIAVIVRD
ncbi:long chain fatty acid-CoA synthetase Faa4p [Mycobacterium sp. MS1601]|uniref:long chain fatty acid-CoA synthetase Faa4p n=1 Tax=Mycobacterium sp. MS1601 TaxID=1936029 RepID=UPI0009796F79|nr:long chain fatty acid-CoA synthetase Faa4p [Mycobacterium sp. MS1601]AQA03362.1 long chain fatty acid-CoA synthetase Faa4p [Mycobacterium sp. MS1601]